MKRNLLLLVAIFIAGSMSAQLYVGARVGYGFGAQKYEVGFTKTDDSKEYIWGSMGEGLPMGLKLGYFFNDNLGIELGINYWIGAEQTAADVNMAKLKYTNVVTAKSSQLRLLPQLVYKSDMGIYGRFGVVMPVSGKTVVTSKEVSPTMAGMVTTEAEVEYKGSFAIGFAGAFGYAFELSDNMHLFGEMEYIALTIKGKTSEVTKYNVNGIDAIPSMDTYDKQTNYVDELNSSSNNGTYNKKPDMTKAKDDLRTSTVYSSFRFNVGITMAF
jgi:opacity protein-like surface antigen